MTPPKTEAQEKKKRKKRKRIIHAKKKKELQLKEMIRNVEERTYFSKKWLDNIEQHRKRSV